ncbi:MAG: shikimate dehydrogenase family protein [Solirubrobacteraceae bacterium]
MQARLMARLGVLGWPVAHSRSPAIHNAALRSIGLNGWRYQRLPVPPHLFEQTVRGLSGAGFLGANVTIPHKQAALALATDASRTAQEIGAANTLTFSADGGIAAENTDAPGLLEALGFDPRGMRAQVLGAGGSARAVVWALLDAGAAEVAVWNRTADRARALAQALGARAVEAPEKADLLVNCTSVGLFVELSASEDQVLNQLGMTGDQSGEYAYVVDLVYRSRSITPLLAAAASRGARTIDGLEILIAQGALSLELWTGCAAPREVMREAAAD